MVMKLFWLAAATYLVLRGALYVLQHRGSSSPELRARVEKHFGAEDIERGFAYARRGFAARVLRTGLEVGLLLVLVQSGLAGRLSARVLDAVGGSWVLHTAVFTGVLTLGAAIVDFPFDAYLGWVLEHRFGFSTQSFSSWLLTRAKDLGVMLIISAGGGLLLYGLLRGFPRAWPVAIPLGLTVFQSALSLVLPTLLIPLYYDTKPLPAGPFRERVMAVLSTAGITVKDVLVIDETRYSRHTNAFFAGLGPTRNIYLYDTLLADHGEEEALAVVAHEAGHWRGRHILKGLLLQGAGLLAGCLILAWLYPRLAGEGRLGWPPLADPGSLPALVLLGLLAGFFAAPLQSGISRMFEREADLAAVELTGKREVVVETEKRLARTNRSQLLPHPLVVWWFYSHPPAIERIEAAGG